MRRGMDEGKIAAVSILLSIILLAFVLWGCRAVPASPLAPGAALPAGTARVTIAAALGDIHGAPLPGVAIALDGRAVAVTDDRGSATFGVPVGREVEIRVSHARYRPFVPAVASTFQPYSHERWFFAFVTD